jgi:predicted Holliday junction resolvase-like endonuclease
MEVNFLYLILFIIGIFYANYLFILYYKKYLRNQIELEFQELIQKERKNAVERSRVVLKGQISEQLSPYLPNFPANPSECKFLGNPVDFVVFSGLDNKKVEEILFIEVKTGNAKLNHTEKSIKEAIENKKIKFVEYRI